MACEQLSVGTTAELKLSHSGSSSGGGFTESGGGGTAKPEVTGYGPLSLHSDCIIVTTAVLVCLMVVGLGAGTVVFGGDAGAENAWLGGSKRSVR